MHKKYKQLWAITFVLVLFAQLASTVFLAQPPQASAAQSENAQGNWSSTEGTIADLRSVPRTRFTFVDPATIKDNVTGAIYKTNSPQSELYDGQFRADGWFWYWPSPDGNGPIMNSSADNPRCTGALVMRIKPRSVGSENDARDLSMYAVTAVKNSQGNCVVAKDSFSNYGGEYTGQPLADYIGKGEDPDDDSEWELKQYNPSNTGTTEAFKMGVATLSWQNKNHILVYGQEGGNLRQVTEEEMTAIENRLSGTDFSGSTLWTTDECKQSNNLPNVFVRVNSSTPAEGRLYYDNDGSYHEDWSNEQLECLFGENYRFNPGRGISTSEPGNLLYIAHSERASTEGEPPTSTGGESEEDNSCESTSGPLGWIMCPVAGMLDSVTGWLEEQILSVMTTKEEYFTGESGEGLYSAWKVLRNIAYTILIPIMLVMVIGTALNFEVFSAYTVKKALPRMVVAVIFITLSWEICMLLINVTNVIGYGIKGLITFPFQAIAAGANGGQDGVPTTINAALNIAGVTQSGGEGIQGAEIAGAAAIGVAGAGAALFAGVGLMTILSTLVTAALILGIVFLVLVARQLFIIAFMLLAPLAILSWIFPGNDKLWKLWWASFSKLLLMFPFIMLLIGVGQIFALITALAFNNGGTVDQIVVIIIVVAALLIPYAMIPFTFKWAGGVFGNLAGMVNDRNKGVLDRLKKSRAERMGENRGKLKNFQRFSDRNAFTRGLNSFSGGVRTGPRAWTPDRLAAARGSAQAAMAAGTLKDDHVFQANQNDDKFLLALGDKKRAQEYLDAAKSAGNTSEAASWSQALANASQVKSRNNTGTKMHALNAHAATGYNLDAGQAGYNQLAEGFIRALGVQESDVVRDEAGNVKKVVGLKAGDYANAMNSAQYGLKNAGRFDLAGINNGSGYDYTRGVDKSSGYTAGNAKIDTHISGAQNLVGDGYAKGGVFEVKNAQGEVTERRTLADQLTRGVANGSVSAQDVVEQHARLTEAQYSATGANKKEIDAQLTAINSMLAGANIPAGNQAGLDNLAAVQAGVDRNNARARRGVDPNIAENP